MCIVQEDVDTREPEGRRLWDEGRRGGRERGLKKEDRQRDRQTDRLKEIEKGSRQTGGEQSLRKDI